jgi:hypothetical protein
MSTYFLLNGGTHSSPAVASIEGFSGTAGHNLACSFDPIHIFPYLQFGLIYEFLALHVTKIPAIGTRRVVIT